MRVEGVSDRRRVDVAREHALGRRHVDAGKLDVVRRHHSDGHLGVIGNDDAAGDMRKLRKPLLEDGTFPVEVDVMEHLSTDLDRLSGEAAQLVFEDRRPSARIDDTDGQPVVRRVQSDGLGPAGCGDKKENGRQHDARNAHNVPPRVLEPAVRRRDCQLPALRRTPAVRIPGATPGTPVCALARVRTRVVVWMRPLPPGCAPTSGAPSWSNLRTCRPPCGRSRRRSTLPRLGRRGRPTRQRGSRRPTSPSTSVLTSWPATL